MANWNVELFDYLITFVMILVALMGVVFGGKKIIEWTQDAFAWARDPARVDYTVKYVDEPDDTLILTGVRFLNAAGLKVSAEEVAQLAPHMIRAAAEGLKQAEGVANAVSKLD